MAPASVGSLVELRQGALRWLLMTVVGAVACGGIVCPKRCAWLDSCKHQHQGPAALFNPYLVGFMGSACIFEGVSLWLNYCSAKRLFGLIAGMESSLLPFLLVSLSFGALLMEQLLMGSVDFVHAAVPGVGFREGQPVYTIITVEWLIGLPMLLILAGKCALGRPIQKIARPIIVTNAYIIIAWSAHFIEQPGLRCSAVALSFAGYFWASWDMLCWMLDFQKVAREDLVFRNLRPRLVMGLIVLFGCYGIVYLCGFLGVITDNSQRITYVAFNIGIKATFAVAFRAINSRQHHELLADLLVNVDNAMERQIASMGIEEPVEELDEKNKFQ